MIGLGNKLLEGGWGGRKQNKRRRVDSISSNLCIHNALQEKSVLIILQPRSSSTSSNTPNTVLKDVLDDPSDYTLLWIAILAWFIVDLPAALCIWGGEFYLLQWVEHL